MLAKLIKFVHPVKCCRAAISLSTKLFSWVKRYQVDIILVIGVILISLLSFAIGYITAKYQEREPIKFEMTNDGV